MSNNINEHLSDAREPMDPDLLHLLRLMRDKGVLRITHDYPLTESQDASDTDIEVWYTAPELGVNGRRRQHYNSNQLGTEPT